ncbi:ubiquinol-cytochrome C reductase hinge protein-domain-containing protein [Neurospora tetraspora]|uniref:Ubiquinol-cytochrome C reductase hinge protein-domain-containing protein n=1 Tax=Neurospora tetraspora TaxID=94610 RepID=A0AAE0JDC8_9PEZI|nr:ubiquinol-cytochrome C reductase hinge protein-domain-containing protein [Neurospora tetraspora]
MGFWDAVTDLIDAATPWATVEAEAPADTPAEAAPASESTEETTKETEAEEPAAAADEPEEEAEEEEEEEDEDEIKDPKETFEEELPMTRDRRTCVDLAQPCIFTQRSPTLTRYGAQLETEHDVLTGVLLTECRNSKECAPAKHHYDECAARVTGAGSDTKEDCVEEFFHLVHCATQCAAPKLWNVLK